MTPFSECGGSCLPVSIYPYDDAQLVRSLLMATARPISVADFPDYLQRSLERAATGIVSTSTLERARWFVAADFSLFPLDHPDAPRAADPDQIGKTPVVSTWKPYQTITPTDDELVAWFGNGDPRNIALVTGARSGVVVVDGDSSEAVAWMHANLPRTMMRTKTARGEHWYFQHPGVPVRNRARIRTGDPAIKIDIRADGGYVVAPGSTHRTRISYDAFGIWPSTDLPIFDPAWVDTGTVADAAAVVESVPDAQSVADVSDEQLIGRASRAHNGEKFDRLWNGDSSLWTGDGAIYPSQSEADAALCEMLAYWTQRNAARMDRLFRLSLLIRDKWDRDDYRERTIRFAIAKCTTVYLPTVQPGSAPPVTDATDCPVCGRDACDGEHSPRQSLYTFAPAFPPGHFVSQWIDTFSLQCDAAHDYHEAAALVALAQATPTLRARMSGSPYGLRTNLYVLFIGDAGRTRKSTSKDYAVEVVKRALPDVVLPQLMTHEGMIEALSQRSHGPALWAIDEFTDLLVKIVNTDYLAGLRGTLLELYAGTDYTYKRVSKKRKAGLEEDALHIVGVNLSLIGCATPTLFQHLDHSAVGSGLLSRFAIVMPESKPPRIPQYELRGESIPSTLVQRLHKIAVRTHDASVQFASGVLERIDTEIDAPLDESSDRGLMTERIGVMARKVAMLSATGRATDDDKVVVSMKDAESAIRVAKRWATYGQTFERRVNETTFEIQLQRCIDILKGRGWIPRREVARRLHVDARTLRDIASTLEDRGYLEDRTVKPTTGRPAVEWRWSGD